MTCNNILTLQKFKELCLGNEIYICDGSVRRGGTVRWCKIKLESKLTMIKLRLKRFGKKNETSFRIVAVHSTSRRDGKPLEELGFYNPRTKESRVNIEAINRRLLLGAQPTETVRSILKKCRVS